MAGAGTDAGHAACTGTFGHTFRNSVAGAEAGAMGLRSIFSIFATEKGTVCCAGRGLRGVEGVQWGLVLGEPVEK